VTADSSAVTADGTVTETVTEASAGRHSTSSLHRGLEQMNGPTKWLFSDARHAR